MWPLVISILSTTFFAFLWGVELAWNNKIMKENKELKARLQHWDNAYNMWVQMMTASNDNSEQPRVLN